MVTRTALLEAAGRVFSRMQYDRARLKDISDDASISLGSLYFHFGNKDDIAAAIIEVEKSRVSEVVSAATRSDGSAVDRLFHLLDGVAELISSDPLVQAGMKLNESFTNELSADGGSGPGAWTGTAVELIREGQEDGSVSSPLSPEEIAEMVAECFVGAQVLSGRMDQWESLQTRVVRSRPMLTRLLAPAPA